MQTFRKALFRFYYRLEAILAPGLRNAQFAYMEFLRSMISCDSRWLDIGCGRRLFPEWMPNAELEESRFRAPLKSAYGLDPDLASLRDNRFIENRVVGDCASLPFADASLDVLTANMVVEHVANPQALLSEAFRVLAPGGVFLFHTPNSNSYATLIARLFPDRIKIWLVSFFEGRKEEDVFPTLYRMNSPGRVRELARSSGLLLTNLNRVESSAQLVMLGPFVVFELLWIRLLRFPSFANFRSNLIVVLQKPSSGARGQ